jgi:PAS domain S-box-containing protein
VPTVDPALPPAERFASRLEFETLVSDLSSRFIDLHPGEVDREIEEALRRVCELLGVDLALLWQWSADAPGVITPTHSYPSRGGPTPPEPTTQEHFPWVREQMLAGRMVSLASLEELPEEAALDRESARLAGIKSNLTLPLAVGGEPPIGALAFNSLRAERSWPDVLVKWLQLVAQIFTNALARRRHEVSLRASEERLALAAESAGAGLWDLDFGTGVIWATEKARTIFGYSPDEVIGMERFEASVHPDDWGFVRGAIERSARTGEPVDAEYRILPGDDAVRWVISRGRPEFTAAGKPLRLMGLSIDVTERNRLERALRTNEARLAAGADLAGLGFYEVDFVEGVMYFEDRLRDLCGIPLNRSQGLKALEFWMEHIHPDDHQSMHDQRQQLHDGKIERLSFEYRYLHPARGERWFHHLARVSTRDATGHALRTYGVLRDITERKRTEEALRDLSRRLIRAHEEERALLARELHDDLTQRLALLAIDVGRAELATPAGPQHEALRAIREGLVHVSEDVHSLAYQLHPSVLEELGLAEALRTECERLGRQGLVDLSVQLDPLPEPLGRDAALCLFRVAQEALNNVFRHAGARTVSVTLRQMERGLILAVRDDGIGFDPANPKKARSLGLESMRERVHLVNGTFDVESALGQGTAIVAWVPAGDPPAPAEPA